MKTTVVDEIFLKYIKDINGIKYFLGGDRVEEDLHATEVLAKACPSYKADDDEEIYIENAFTCYNCRYRRWAQNGFNCFKGFPAG